MPLSRKKPFKKLTRQELLTKITSYMVKNKTRDCATTGEIAKHLDVSCQTALKYLKSFVKEGKLARDPELTQLFWINKESY